MVLMTCVNFACGMQLSTTLNDGVSLNRVYNWLSDAFDTIS